MGTSPTPRSKKRSVGVDLGRSWPAGDTATAAVLITDPQIDFLKPESVVWDKVGETVEENAVVDKLGRLRAATPEAEPAE